MSKYVVLACLLALLISAPAEGAGYGRSTVWQQPWTTYAFPAPPGTNTPQMIFHVIQLPANTQAGDLVQVDAAEEFSNPSDYRSSGDSIRFPSGLPSEHWTVPIFMTCDLVTSPSVAGPWTELVRGGGENVNGMQHHWPWDSTTQYLATDSTASDYVAVRCWFGRSTGYRDPLYDWIVGEKGYGHIEYSVIIGSALR